MKKVTESLEKNLEQDLYSNSEIPFLTDSTDARSNFNQEAAYQNLLGQFKNYNYFNLNYDNVYYGKINNNNEFIIPKSSYVQEVENITQQYFLLNFVKDAYNDFVKEWEKLKRKNILNEVSMIEIRPKKAYEHYETLYNDLMKRHYTSFVNFVNTSKLQNQITDFNSFLKVFSQYALNVTPRTPITLTKFVSSKYCSNHVSGLFIDTLDNSQNNYSKKIDDYLNNINFEVYVELAIMHGFIIDKNLPWRLIANLESENMKKYIQKYTDSKNPYEFFFEKTENFDLILIKKHVLKFYNNFVDQFPSISIKENKICNNKFKIKEIKINRSKLTEFDVNLHLTETSKNWWKLYCFIKISESNILITQAEFNKIVNLSFEYLSKLDMQKAMHYVTQQIKKGTPAKVRARTYTF